MDNMITGKVLLRYFEEGTLRTRVKKMGVESSFHADFFVEEFSAVARLPKQNHQAPNRAQVSPPPQSEKHSTKPPAGPSGPKAAPTPTSADEAIHTPAEEHDALGVPPLSEEEVAKATEEGAVEIATAKIDEVLGAVGSIADLDDGILGGIGAQVVGGALDFVGKALANTPVGFLVGPVWAAAGAIFEASLQVHLWCHIKAGLQ